MRARLSLSAALCSLTLLPLGGCHLPGRPAPGPEIPRPAQVLSFDVLYGENCAACHGANGQNGAATNLANPEYEALIDDASLRNVIANGEKGSLMPAFALASGGDLTEAQVDAIGRGMRARWARPNVFAGVTPPPYGATRTGDVGQGGAVYVAACAHCHGVTAQQPGPAGSILDGSFLALMNAQTIRTTIIAGRPDIGQPDWRGDVPGQPLTDAEITNVTAWLLAQTPAHPGHPYPTTQPNAEQPGEAQPLSEKK